MALLPLLGVLPLLGLVLLSWGNAALDRLLITKVRSDLAVAHGYFERVLGEVAGSAAAVADSHALYAALTAPGALDAAALRALLGRFKQREGLDFIHLRAADGRLLGADFEGATEASAPPPAAWLALASAAQPQRVAATVAVLPPDQQGLLAPALRARVAVPLLATRNAQPSARLAEDRAMVLRAGAPVLDTDGRVIAWVELGLLLNRNLPFIDHINAIVYPEGALPFGSQGTATLFLDDVRISTNVRLFDAGGGEGRVPAGDLTPVLADAASGAPASATAEASASASASVSVSGSGSVSGEQRAIGTRVSAAVREAVLGRGETWLDRAFVVNDWFVSAYQPLRDGAGQRVGMLYVGYLERPFTLLKYNVLAGIGAVFFGVMIVAALAVARWARQIFGPIERMASTLQQVEGGASQARVGVVASGDEIGALAGHLDHLLDTIADKTAALEHWNAVLDAKVAERSLALEAAQTQLLRTEKMAAMGQLTASIAHEVNNPVAVIQGNLDLVREVLGPQVGAVRTELKLVDEQIARIRLIVTQLLQFARPNEFAGYAEAVSPAQALEDCLVLTAHLLARTRIVVERDFSSQRAVHINRHELQQVLVNLLVNAIQTMPDGGRLSLRCRDWQAPATTETPAGAPGVCIEVADTGPGLHDELLGALFQPFVTRKKDGTGLGLWISRGIVERYGGDLRAGNRPSQEGSGALMSVLLLSEMAAIPG